MTHSPIAVITFNVIPHTSYTFKYERLGRMAIVNRGQYCKRHRYTFIHDVRIPEDRPACWAKIPAILDAFDSHRWVLWADSDALVLNNSRSLEGFCDPNYDLIVQSHDQYFDHLGIDRDAGYEQMPINTGVFLIQATDWSREFLRLSYEKKEFISRGEIWDGVGEQEAMTAVLKERPGFLERIRYVDGLQNHPRFYRSRDLFAHFYGNYAKHRIPLSVCEEVLQRWEQATERGEPYPEDLMRFHWCCIQNKDPTSRLERGDLERYLYQTGDIEGPGWHQ